jgi:hypothetical protein
MADSKMLAALDTKHAQDSVDRRLKIETAISEVRAAETMLREAREKARKLQADQINASFAYDAERARLQGDDRAAA